MDIAEWLRGLGLAQYEPAFRENAIDESVLPSLTAEDLRDLGVTMVGYRRKLLDAIASLHAVDVPPAGTPLMVLVGGGPLPTPPPLAPTLSSPARGGGLGRGLPLRDGRRLVPNAGS